MRTALAIVLLLGSVGCSACGPADEDEWTLAAREATCACACEGERAVYRGMAHDNGVICDCGEPLPTVRIIRPGYECWKGD